MEKNTKKITIKIDGQEWKNAQDKALDKALKNAKIDGFRKGKVPKDVFIKKYGKESLFFDAADEVIDSAYEKMIKENKDLELVARPEISLKNVDEDNIEFDFILTLKPEVKLGQYKGLKVKKEKAKVTEKEIKEVIDNMRNKYAENVVKEDGKVEDGDIAIIDFEGFLNDKPFDGGKGENYSLTIGSGTFIPGFEEQLIGMKKDEEKDLNITFPEDYHAEDLKGKPVVFKVKVNEIKQVKIPDLDKDFFEDLGMEGVDSAESLEKTVKENMLSQKEISIENQYIDKLLEEAAKNCEVDIPEAMINDELERMVGQYEEHLKMQGLTLEQLYQFTNSNEEALRSEMREEAVKRIKFRLMLEAIAKEEKIEITDEQASKEAEEMAKKYQMEKEEFLNTFGGLEMIKYDKQMRAAIELLKGE